MRSKKQRPDAVTVYEDGREVCADTEAGKREYLRRKHILVSRQLNICAICRKFSNDLDFDHQAGRGMGGSRRDDRVWFPDGSPMNAALCRPCNTLKASRRYEWRDGVYQPVGGVDDAL